MSVKNFRTYNLSVEFHNQVSKTRVPYYLKDQLVRASSSICLNLSEGSARSTAKDRHRFYRMALGSQRECASILQLSEQADEKVKLLCDELGGNLYKLVKAANH